VLLLSGRAGLESALVEVMMPRKLRFAINMVIGLVLMLILGLGGLMVHHAPGLVAQAGGKVASVDLRPFKHDNKSDRTARVFGHDFDCLSPSPKVDRCTADLLGKPLTMTLTYPTAERRIFSKPSCAATYDGRPVSCSPWYDYATYDLPNIMFADVDTPNQLNLSDRDLQTLQQKNFLSNFYDNDWTRLPPIIALVFAFVAAYANYLGFDLRHWQGLGFGLGLGFILTWLSLVPIEGIPATPLMRSLLNLLIQTDSWSEPVWIFRFTPLMALPLMLGALAIAAQALKRSRGWRKLMPAALFSLATFVFVWSFGLFSIVILGYAD